jgi:uncharacterized protein YggE
VSRFGDESIESAPAWLEYGSALLVKEEENPSDDLLAAATAEAKKQAAVLGQELAVSLVVSIKFMILYHVAMAATWDVHMYTISIYP